MKQVCEAMAGLRRANSKFGVYDVKFGVYSALIRCIFGLNSVPFKDNTRHPFADSRQNHVFVSPARRISHVEQKSFSMFAILTGGRP